MNLTDRQKQVLAFVKKFTRKNGFPPTRKEIAAFFKWDSLTAAENHLRALERHGAITIAAGISRGIAIVRGRA